MKIETSEIIGTGFRRLNEYIGGWHRPSLVLLTAETGIGLTSFALTLVKSFLRETNEEIRVLYFSLKLEKSEICRRLVSSHSGLSMEMIRSGELSEAEKEHLYLLADQLKKLPITIDDSKYLSISSITSKIREIHSLSNCGMVIIDFIQIAQCDDYKTSEILEQIAVELNLILIVLVKKNDDFNPQDDKIEGAFHAWYGNLLSRSDLILFLFKDELGNPDERIHKYFFPYQVLIAKNRYGMNKSFPVAFNSEICRFFDPDRHGNTLERFYQLHFNLF